VSGPVDVGDGTQARNAPAVAVQVLPVPARVYDALFAPGVARSYTKVLAAVEPLPAGVARLRAGANLWTASPMRPASTRDNPSLSRRCPDATYTLSPVNPLRLRVILQGSESPCE
jgi:hypothetical protein